MGSLRRGGPGAAAEKRWLLLPPQFLQEKRGKQEVDLLGDALRKYFQSTEAQRREGETLADYELRHSSLVRDMKKAMVDVGSRESIPSEILGWFVRNQVIKLDASDIAGVKVHVQELPPRGRHDRDEARHDRDEARVGR